MVQVLVDHLLRGAIDGFADRPTDFTADVFALVVMRDEVTHGDAVAHLAFCILALSHVVPQLLQPLAVLGHGTCPVSHCTLRCMPEQ